MDRTYGSAALVVVSVTSENTSVPFLGLTAPNLRRTDKRIEVRIQKDDGPVISLFALKAACDAEYLGIKAIERGKGPVDQRAWAFQEGKFAVRCVRYALFTISWQCPHHLRFECIDQVDRSRDNWRTTNDSQMPIMWNMLVEDYSKRSITYPGDRLPALSGMASRFQSLLKTTYVAGMWESNLYWGIGWLSLHNGLHHGRCGGEKIRSEYRGAHVAPSWSWASIPCPIIYSGGTYLRPQVPTNMIKVFNVDCKPTTGNPWGEVPANATIRLRGRMTDCFLRQNKQLDKLDEPMPIYSLHRGQKVLNNVFQDCALTIAPKKSGFVWTRQVAGQEMLPHDSGLALPVKLLLLYTWSHPEFRVVTTALILSNVSEEPNIIQRAACLDFEEEQTDWRSWFHDAKELNIRLQ